MSADITNTSGTDCSGIAASVTFTGTQTSETFSVSATADIVDDDGENIKLTFGTLPTGITEGVQQGNGRVNLG